MARSKNSEQSTTPSSGLSSRFRRKPKDPNKKPGRLAQIRQIYQVSRQTDPNIGWWMLLSALVVFAVLLVVGLFTGHPYLFGFFGIMFGLMVAMLVMSRRAERAAYKSIEGKAGATGAALGALRRGWYYDKEPVAAEAPRGRNPRDIANAAMVFRAIGRPGVVLVAEGPKGPAIRLAESERKKVTRVTGGNVPITVLRIGQGDDAVPVNKLTKRITKLKPTLTKAEVSAVNKRLKALGGLKPPVPAGVDPTKVRMDRKGLKGR
jgi:hypothetical protein